MAAAQRTVGEDGDTSSWSAWYSDAREDMAFRYGIRRVPKDRYKEEFALGHTPHAAARNIYNQMQIRGEIK